MNKGKYEYWKSDANGQWYWHLKAANNKVILQSEGYHSLAGCGDGIYAMRKSVSVRDRLLVLISNDSRYYFTIKADNHEILGASQMYKSIEGCKKGHAAVMRNRSTKEVVAL